ncbi:MAG: Efflux transporter, family, subunit [Bryobacterales bacterium]|nr:Efflux transporter, family, subunit [Bryobacterales bacterium]
MCGRAPARPKLQSKPDSDVPSVGVARVQRQDLQRDLVLSAEFRPYEEVDLHAKVAGFLKEIRVDVGDRVRAGQLIATLEIPEMVDEDAQAEATRKRSEAELVHAQGELARAQSAHEAAHLNFKRLDDVVRARPALVARQEIDNALAKDRESEAQVDSAKAAITAAEQQIRVSQASEQRVHTLEAYQRITAPFAGVISKRYADPGAMIQAGTSSSSQALPLVRLSETARLRLVLAVPESAVPRIRVGSPIAIRVTAVNRQFQGKVSRFSGRLQSDTRTMETEVDVDNSRGDLAPGMFAEAVVTLDRHNGALSIPMQAVAGAEDKATLLVLDSQNQLEQKEVRLGLETADRREVLSGLDEGQLVVVGKAAGLRPGLRVRPQEAQ